MKLDMDLARLMMLAIEASDDDPGGWVALGKFRGHSDIEVSYHIKLLDQAGFIEADDLRRMGEDGFCWRAKQLTWKGHQFLIAARNEGVWERAKREINEKAGAATIDVLMKVLSEFALRAVG